MMKSFAGGETAMHTLAATIAYVGLTTLRASAIEQPPPAQPVPGKIEIADGSFKATWESLKQYRCPDWFRGGEGSEFRMECARQTLTGRSQATGSWAAYTTNSMGTFQFEKAATHTLTVKSKTPPAWKVIGLKAVVLQQAASEGVITNPKP